MECQHLSGDECKVASRICGLESRTTAAACKMCIQQINPKSLNYVTGCLALATIRKAEGMDAWRKLRQSIHSHMVLSRPKKEYDNVPRVPTVVECDQNIGGICAVASHLAKSPIGIDSRCQDCRKLGDWRMPNLVTATMAIDQNRSLAGKLRCYTQSDGTQPGAYLKQELYELGVRGLRRCERDVVERMNRLGLQGCREKLIRLIRMLARDAEAGGYDWVFAKRTPSEIIAAALTRTEQSNNGPTR